VQRIRTGDYALKGYEKITLCERKGAWTEICSNLFTADRPRFIAAFDRLAVETKHPILLLDLPVRTRGNKYARNPEQLLDGIFYEATKRGISVLVVPPSTQRYRAGEWLFRLMWQYIYNDVLAYKPVHTEAS